jgi:Subtilase family
MTDVICPNCHSVVPPWKFCLTCYIPLATALDPIAEPAAVSLGSPAVAAGANAPEVIANPLPQMDPHLVKWIRRRDQGLRKLKSASQDSDKLSVTAIVYDIAALEKIGGVEIVTRIPPTEKDKTWIVTAQIPLSKIEEIHQQPFVKSLKAARRINPSLEKTLEETGAQDNRLAIAPLTSGGQGVIVGIIDFGMDFMHRNFRLPGVNGNSRIAAIWDQSAPANPRSPQPFGYGKLYLKEDIDAAIQQKEKDPYEALGYAPPPESLFVTGAHGTYVADIAAGNGEGSGCLGVAPGADIVFVEFSTKCLPVEKNVVGNTFGDTRQLIDAVQFILDFAAKRNQPCVINLSLDTNGGPHDGKTPVELMMDRVLDEAPDRAIVVSAANLSGKQLHASGKISTGQTVDLVWQVFPNDTTLNELEIWYPRNDQLKIAVIKPDGETKGTADFGETLEFSFGEKSTMVVVNRRGDPINGDNTINVFFERAITPGLWTLRLTGVAVADGNFHAWIERDETGQSRFAFKDSAACKIDDDCTLGSIACGEKTIVVSGFDAHKQDLPLCEFSSRGPTRDGRPKPEVSAPGEAVFAAHSRTLVQRHKVSGTSMSAAAVTGVVALLLAEAKAQGISLPIDTIRNILMQKARKNPPTGNGENRQYGQGRAFAPDAVAAIREALQ